MSSIRATPLLAALLIGLASAEPLSAQDPAAHLGAWYAAEAGWRPSQARWGVEGDLQLRDFRVVGDFAQTSLRAGVVHHFAGRPLRLTVGGAWFLDGEPGPGDATRREWRSYQTLVAGQRLTGRLRLAHRLRTEQRWFEVAGFRTRVRYRLGLEVGLGRGGSDGRPAGTGEGLLLIVSDEVLVNGETTLDDGSGVERLDQNRAYVALNWPLHDGARIEVGYLNVTRFDQSPRHRIRVTLKAGG